MLSFLIFLPISCCSELQSSWRKHHFDGVVSNFFPNVHCVTVFLGHLMGKKKIFVPVSLKAIIRVYFEFWRKTLFSDIIVYVCSNIKFRCFLDLSQWCVRNSGTGLLRLYLKKNWSFCDLENKETELPQTS